jgi:hypothetical protein
VNGAKKVNYWLPATVRWIITACLLLEIYLGSKVALTLTIFLIFLESELLQFYVRRRVKK